MSSGESEAARIFLEAVEHRDGGRRAGFVREAVAGDPHLLLRVDALLKAHGEPNPRLEGDRLVPMEDVPQPSERQGTEIGPYKLLEQIGEGGHGTSEGADGVSHPSKLLCLRPDQRPRHAVLCGQ
jgi:hypothetical protein